MSRASFRNTIHHLFALNKKEKVNINNIADIATASATGATTGKLMRSHFPLVILKVAGQVQLSAVDSSQTIIQSANSQANFPVQVSWMARSWYASDSVQKFSADFLSHMRILTKRITLTSSLKGVFRMLTDNGKLPLIPNDAVRIVINAGKEHAPSPQDEISLSAFAYIMVHVVSFSTSRSRKTCSATLRHCLESGLKALSKLLDTIEARSRVPKTLIRNGAQPHKPLSLESAAFPPRNYYQNRQAMSHSLSRENPNLCERFGSRQCFQQGLANSRPNSPSSLSHNLVVSIDADSNLISNCDRIDTPKPDLISEQCALSDNNGSRGLQQRKQIVSEKGSTSQDSTHKRRNETGGLLNYSAFGVAMLCTVFFGLSLLDAWGYLDDLPKCSDPSGVHL